MGVDVGHVAEVADVELVGGASGVVTAGLRGNDLNFSNMISISCSVCRTLVPAIML